MLQRRNHGQETAAQASSPSGVLMAPRTTKIRHDDETRAKIQTSQLINRLTDHALGGVDLTTTQVKAIEVLLRKSLPDLSAVATASADSAEGRQILCWDDGKDEATVQPPE